MPDSTIMTQEELKELRKWERDKMKEKDSFEGILEAMHICPVGYDSLLIAEVLHDIPRRYRIKAQEFYYFLLSDIRGSLTCRKWDSTHQTL